MATHNKDLVIKFISLPAGIHEFNFHMGNEFFEQYSNSIIHKAKLEVKVALQKSTTMEMDIEIDGEVEVECGRCLENFTLPVNAHQHVLIRMVENPDAEDDDNDTIHIANSASEIVLNNHIYDFVTLEIPYNPTHPDIDDKPGCVNEALDALSDNQEEDKPKEIQDERWSALKKIKLN
ncbi:MAG: YceD family protein [Bacteroidota bacterium]